MKLKILMYEFLYDYVKPKYGEKTKLCFMNTASFTVYINRWHLWSRCRICWNLNFKYFKLWIRIMKLWNKIKKVLGLMKDKLGGKIMKKLLD